MSQNELKSKQKLQWLGLSRAARSLSNVEEEINLLEKYVDDYDAFQDHLENGYDYNDDGSKESIGSYENFKSYLTSIGFEEGKADRFIEKIKQSFSSFSDFKNFAINEVDSFEALKTGFDSSNQITAEVENENDQSMAGIKFHESQGVTRKGVTVPAGTTEIYGSEIHFSQSTTSIGEDTSDGDPSGSGGFEWSNIRTKSGDTQFPVYSTATIQADVTNNYTTLATVTASFIEDGSQISNDTVAVPGGETETVEFTVNKSDYTSHDYQIRNTSAITVSWIPQGIER